MNNIADQISDTSSLLPGHNPITENPNSNIKHEPNQLMSQGKKKVLYTINSFNINCKRYYTPMKTAARYAIIVVGLFSVLYLLVGLLNGTSPVVDSDRGPTYKVKTIPATLDDDALNALPKESFSYLAMIDAGSSGCRAHVYKYGKLGSATGPLYVLPQHVSKKVKPGLSSFVNKPEDAGASLEGLVDFLKEQVPESDWSVTPIWLKATAGLRMIEKQKAESILNSVRLFLSDKQKVPFLFRPSYVKLISGNEEGGFGWIAYNYLKKIIGPKRVLADKFSPYAVVEMGGASAQVSQMAPTAIEAKLIPSEYRFSFTIEQETFHLYTHSYLGYGAEQGREMLNKHLLESIQNNPSEKFLDPCLNDGYTRSNAQPRKETYEGPFLTSNITVFGKATSDSCSKAIESAFENKRKKSNCENQLPNSSISTIGCVSQPSFVTNSDNFLVFENFYYMSSAIGVKELSSQTIPANGITKFPLVTTPSRIVEASGEYCKLDWNNINNKYPLDSQPKDVNTKMCFISSYAYEFLVEGIKVSKDKIITIQKDVGNSEIEWALGAAYKETADFLKRSNLRPT
eukprot:gene13941-18698_t